MARNISRIVGSAGEYVVTDKDSILHLFSTDSETLGTIQFRDDGLAVLVAQIAGMTATPAAGGSLVDDTYFVKVQGVDRHGDLGTASAEDTADTSGGNNSVAVAFTEDPNAVEYRVYVGLATNDYDGYFVVDGSPFTFGTLVFDEVHTGDAPVATTGNSRLKAQADTGLPQTGKLVGGRFAHGITLYKDDASDNVMVIWEPLY